MTASVAPAHRSWPSRPELLGIGAFWLTIGLLSVVREAVRPWRQAPLEAAEVVGTAAEFGLWALVTVLAFWVVGRFPARRGALAGPLAAQGLLAAGGALAVEGVTRGLLRPPGPPGRGPGPDWQWTLGEALRGLWFLDELLIALAILAAGYARSALADARVRQAEADRLLAEQARLEGQLAEARLAALQMQLHPHFLFNTLNAVSALVERDPAGVRTMIARLSSLLRRVLDTEPERETPLREEAAFVRDYLDVQRVRFQGRLGVEEDYAPETLDALVPPLVLQPLVENAVVHGIGRIEDEAGTVRVSAHRARGPEGDRLVVAVEDDGPGLDGPAARSGGVGLANTRARLAALYGAAGTLSVEPRLGGGVRAEVTVPFRTASAPPASEAAVSAAATVGV